MPRILVVEDIEETREELRLLLSEGMRDSVVVTAGTSKEALNCLARDSAAGRKCDVVIVDYKLPPDVGHNDEVDESICSEVRKTIPGALLVHITAYPNDKRVRDHAISTDLGDPAGPRCALISKLEGGWPKRLLRMVKAHVYGRSVRARMQELFGPGTGSSADVVRRESRVRTGERSTTHELAALCRDIMEHWHDLDGSLQDEIRQVFRVDETTDPIRISLL
jgi:CheY-like chemotaxis protein